MYLWRDIPVPVHDLSAALELPVQAIHEMVLIFSLSAVPERRVLQGDPHVDSHPTALTPRSSLSPRGYIPWRGPLEEVCQYYSNRHMRSEMKYSRHRGSGERLRLHRRFHSHSE